MSEIKLPKPQSEYQEMIDDPDRELKFLYQNEDLTKLEKPDFIDKALTPGLWIMGIIDLLVLIYIIWKIIQ